uniref:Uncharacterized protein n=1 Tax=Myoviridae sp. ctQve5 TaxID=2825103 RepID=A0A8S5PW69_9CAUD|nr:MAG TPA: hypothetical protein [Myoviridae sp. ctQve5]
MHKRPPVIGRFFHAKNNFYQYTYGGMFENSDPVCVVSTE